MTDQRLLTTAQAADRLQVEARSVARWLRRGRLRGYKFGAQWRIAPGDLERFLESREPRPRRRRAAPAAGACPVETADASRFTTVSEPFKIQIRAFEFQPIEDARYLKVRTYPRPTNRSVRLGLIEWVEGGRGDVTFKTLVNRKPMSHDDAMAYAKRFAEKFEVPVIYQREDGTSAH